MQRAKDENKLLVLEAEAAYNVSRLARSTERTPQLAGSQIPIYERIGWKVKFQAEHYKTLTPEGFDMWVMVANEEGAK
jgi:hypothetical protein